MRKVTGAQNSQHVGFTSQFKSRPSLVTLADSTFARAVEGLPRERILTVLVFGGHILCANQTLPVYSTKSYEIHALPFLNLFNDLIVGDLIWGKNPWIGNLRMATISFFGGPYPN